MQTTNSANGADLVLLSTPILGPATLPLKIDDKVIYYKLWYYTFGNERWIAAVAGSIEQGESIPLRIESACIFGHVFHSQQCDCGFQLDQAFRTIAKAGRGVIVYGVDHDARGAGMDAHFQIYYLRQQENLDTEEVYKRLNRPWDSRNYEPVAAILRHLGVQKVVLLSNNSARKQFLIEQGFDVQSEALEAPIDEHNMATLMLEKEDLSYTWSFKTHGDWLADLQAEVVTNPDFHGAALVQNTHDLQAKHISDDWSVAQGLYMQAEQRASQSSELVIYLTDFPRVDELPLYAAIGARFVVVPFAIIPDWLREAGTRAGIRIQDWERKNKYILPRPQWELAHRGSGFDVYERCNALRFAFLNPASRTEASEFLARFTSLEGRLGSGALVVQKQCINADSPWFEIAVRTDVTSDVLAEFGIQRSTSQISPGRTVQLLLPMSSP